MEPNHIATCVQQGSAITERLGPFQHAEADGGGVASGFVRNTDVFRHLGRELDEEPMAGVAFVQLACGVEEARSVPDRGRHLQVRLDLRS